MVIVCVVGERYVAAWVNSRSTVSALVEVLERVTRNSGHASPGAASSWTASMLTRGTALLLVTVRSVKPPASLPLASSITAPVLGFS